MNTTARSALTGMLLLAGVSGAEAQEGLGTVVCVGSELESMASAGPVRRVIRKDVELVYRAAVEFAGREEIEEGLREELSQSEVRCNWSEPGSSHVVVVSYTGVIRLDLTIDPDDPRFQGFSVGYGTDWDGAEANARLDARFDTYYDGSGYEVIVREQWNIGGARAAAGAAREEPRPAVPAPAAARGAGRRPGERFSDCAACPEMVVLPPGSFMMGSPESSEEGSGNERPQHRVTIESPFAVGVYEVTFAEWDACVGAGGCGGYSPPDYAREGDRHPVTHVSWEDAQQYVRWLSREMGETYRLLSEAEWEYMARAGTQTERYWEDDESRQCSYANGYDATAHEEKEYDFQEPVACSDYHVETAPVGSFRANAWGLYDVLGNAWEWTEDCWNGDYAGAPADGSARRMGDCSQRVLRGGSWGNDPRALRSAYRGTFLAGDRDYDVGFRVARTMTARQPANNGSAGAHGGGRPRGPDISRSGRSGSCPDPNRCGTAAGGPTLGSGDSVSRPGQPDRPESSPAAGLGDPPTKTREAPDEKDRSHCPPLLGWRRN